MKKAKAKENKLKSYRVWFEQVNQTYVDVDASNEESAKVEAVYQWQRQNLPPAIDCIAPLDRGALRD